MKLFDRKVEVKANIQPAIESLWRRFIRRLDEWNRARPYKGVEKLKAKVDKKIAKAEESKAGGSNGWINR